MCTYVHPIDSIVNITFHPKKKKKKTFFFGLVELVVLSMVIAYRSVQSDVSFWNALRTDCFSFHKKNHFFWFGWVGSLVNGYSLSFCSVRCFLLECFKNWLLLIMRSHSFIHSQHPQHHKVYIRIRNNPHSK